MYQPTSLGPPRRVTAALDELRCAKDVVCRRRNGRNGRLCRYTPRERDGFRPSRLITGDVCGASRGALCV